MGELARECVLKLWQSGDVLSHLERHRNGRLRLQGWNVDAGQAAEDVVLAADLVDLHLGLFELDLEQCDVVDGAFQDQSSRGLKLKD